MPPHLRVNLHFKCSVEKAQPNRLWRVHRRVKKCTPDQIADDSLLLKITVLALRVGRTCISIYGHQFAPKRFTQPQVFASIVLKEVL